MFFAKQPEPETLNSRLLPDLFDLDKLGSGRPIRVLDFGQASSHTFQFLNGFNCRLQVADVRQGLTAFNRWLAEDREREPEAIADALAGVFDFLGDNRYDVCLLWDSLNYLDSARLRLVARLLLPHLAPAAKLHGFAVLNRNTAVTEQNYGIVDAEWLIVSGQSSTELPQRHSQSAIKDALVGLSVRQSILREDGRLEMILTAA